MNTYFEVAVRYNKITNKGEIRKMSESFIVEAYTFTEAEARIVQEIQSTSAGDFEITAIKKAKYSEIVFDKYGLVSGADADAQKILGMNSRASGDADKWYRVKINMPHFDDETGKEKKESFNLLVNAGSINAAHDIVVVHMKGSVCDYEIVNIDETKIVDCLFVEAQVETEESISNSVLSGEKSFAKDSLMYAAKKFIDSVPDGHKVTISAGGISTTIDKSNPDSHIEDS